MSENDRPSASRRAVLRAGVGLAAGAAAIGTAAAQQAPKLAKSIVMYQDTPKNGEKCSQCVQFIAPNACKVVEGVISPNGWCGAYAPKQS